MPFLGIDIGTSAVKAVLVDGEQRLLAEAEVPLAISRPHPLWSEQAPDAWWAATREALAGLRAGAPDGFAATQAVGLSGQMHGAVVLDAADRPLRPAILWNDARAQAECHLLMERVPDLGRIAGIPAMPSFTAPKLLWLAQHEPDVFARIAHVLLPKDYVALQLTGDHFTDPCDAAGSLWLDEAARAWSPEILAATGLTAAQMPRIVEGIAAGCARCARPSPPSSACHRASRWPAAPATLPPVPSASAPSTTATASSRWAPRRSTSSPRPATGLIRSA